MAHGSCPETEGLSPETACLFRCGAGNGMKPLEDLCNTGSFQHVLPSDAAGLCQHTAYCRLDGRGQNGLDTVSLAMQIRGAGAVDIGWWISSSSRAGCFCRCGACRTWLRQMRFRFMTAQRKLDGLRPDSGVCSAHPTVASPSCATRPGLPVVTASLFWH